MTRIELARRVLQGDVLAVQVEEDVGVELVAYEVDLHIAEIGLDLLYGGFA